MSGPAVKAHGPPDLDPKGLEKLSKAQLIAIILEQREDARQQLAEKDRQITELKRQLAKLQGEIDQDKTGQKIKDINQAG